MAQSDILLTANNRNQLYVLQYSSGQYNEFVPLYDELQEFLVSLVANNPEKFKTAQGYKELQKLANAEIDRLILAQNLQFVDDYPLFAKQQAEFVELSLNRAVTGYIASMPPISVIMKEAYRVPMVLSNKPFTLDELSKDITTATKKNVRDALFLGFSEGRTTDQIITTIKGNNTGIKGAIPQSRLDTERVVRTSLNHVATTSRQRTYKENNDLVWGYLWLSTLDSRTSYTCRFFDGQLFKYKDSYNPLPPAHFMCRSTTTPDLNPKFKIKGLGDSRRRAAKGAEGGTTVKGNPSYYEWLKTQPASFQDEALGKTKGLIFRNSGLSPEEFKKASVNRYGKPLTIDQMKDKNASINDYLGED